MGIIEELIFGGAKEIAEEAATVGAIKGLGKALSGVKNIHDRAYERKLKEIREVYPDAYLLTEFVETKRRKHFGYYYLSRKVSYMNKDREPIYTVSGKLESPVHVLRLHHNKKLIGTVMEVPQGDDGSIKTNISYRGKHFVSMYYKLTDKGINGLTFEDNGLAFRWLDKAKTKAEVYYNNKLILKKGVMEYIITFPENEERCMLLAMALLAAESPRWVVREPVRRGYGGAE